MSLYTWAEGLSILALLLAIFIVAGILTGVL